MVLVSPRLIEQHVSDHPLLSRAYAFLEGDEEIQELLKMSNLMAVTRLRYNDHGIVHARIVAGASLELLGLLADSGVTPTTLRDGSTRSFEEAELVVLLAAYLHDIGNSFHRLKHEYIGALLAKDILDRILPKILEVKGRRLYTFRQEVLHAIYATEYNTRCLTVEAAVVKIGDGLDMSEGRARVPYRLGKVDMHSVSALSIRRVEVERGVKPIRIKVYMDDLAGLFQLEEVLNPKIKTSGIEDKIEVSVVTPDRTLNFYPPQREAGYE